MSTDDQDEETKWHPAQPPQVPRSDTEYNLVVQSGPLDSKWFHDWRRELRGELRDIRSDLSAVKIAQTRLDQRMDGVTERIGRVEKHVQSVDARVVTMENAEAVVGAVESKIRHRNEDSMFGKAWGGFAAQIGGYAALGVVIFVGWLLLKFVKEYQP